jgi:hypothetical protein
LPCFGNGFIRSKSGGWVFWPRIHPHAKQTQNLGVAGCGNAQIQAFYV